LIATLGERKPTFDGDGHFVAESADVVGSVRLGPESSVWFGAVIRADNDDIILGARSNVQDGATLHTDPGFALTVGTDVTIGHRAMLHGCTVGDGSLIGIGSVILNGASIGRHCLVGASALVTEGKTFPDRSLIVGAPAKVVRSLSDDEVAQLEKSAAIYVRNAARYRASLKPL